MPNKLYTFTKTLLARKAFYPLNKLFYRIGLSGLGVLNYETPRLSGESNFLKKFFSQCKGQPVVLDVGANIGNFSKLVRDFCKEAKIYAFEPHPETFKELEKNARQYHFTAFNVGCGEQEGRLKFYDYQHSGASSHATFVKSVIEKIHGSSCMETEAAMVQLDHFAKKHGIQKINLMKVDAEGYDFMVIKGAEGLIRENRVEVILFEFNEMNVVSRVFLRDFYDFLTEYNFYRLMPDGVVTLGTYNPIIYEIFAYQNIVAIRKDLAFSF